MGLVFSSAPHRMSPSRDHFTTLLKANQFNSNPRDPISLASYLICLTSGQVWPSSSSAIPPQADIGSVFTVPDNNILVRSCCSFNNISMGQVVGEWK